MKKFVIFFAIVIIILCGISYMYLNYKADINTSKRENLEFENYLNVEVYGTELATIINRVMDNNKKNDIEKDNKGMYIDNNQNSIKIEVKMLDNDSTYQAETFFNGGIQNFVNYYGHIKFKCMKITYHESTNKVKHMLFEQITS